MSSFWLQLKMSLLFLKIGSVSFGGAYSIWALVRQEFVEKEPQFLASLPPLSPDAFYNFMEVGQLTPGPNINGILLVGEHYLGLSGIFLVFVSLLLPSVVAMVLFYKLNRRLGAHPAFVLFKQGALAAVIGILFFFLIKLGEKIPKESLWETMPFALLAVAALYLIHFRKFNIILTTLLSGTLFWLYSLTF